jgi:hypothetical protein
MEKTDKKEREFYVGYHSVAPNDTAVLIRKLLTGGLFIMIVLCALLVMKQKRFSSNTFNYGELTTLEGYLSKFPVPHLRMPVGKDSNGSECYQKILLVGSGKQGAQKWISELEQIHGTVPAGKVAIVGNLIYGEGKAWMQVDNAGCLKIINKVPLDFGQESPVVSQRVNITGEIVDPKCYFGVMKPGEGKVHRSCAARCIAGGIPPVFHSDDGEFYLLTMDNNLAIVYERIAPLIGERISFNAEEDLVDDWKILKVNQSTLSKAVAQMKNRRLLEKFQKDITLCSR